MFGEFHDLFGCSSEHGPRRGRWPFGGWEMYGPGIWGTPGGARGPHGAHRRHGRGGRMFEQGDLKYVILRLLAEKPRHGYEIIKALEERSGGHYSPSPGTVYPTLTLLEDLGFARGREEEAGRKIYEITEAGRAHLEENSDTVESIFDRMSRFVEGLFDAPMAEAGQAFSALAANAYAAATRGARDPEHMRRLREILERAAREIEALGRETPKP